MKAYFSIIIMFLFTNVLFSQSQTSLIIHLKEGGTADYYLTDIDSITFSETVKDFDGNTYQTITIGDQVWMAENLKVTHYRNGDPIPNVTDNTEWINQSSGAFCVYDNDDGNKDTYGLLYNWYAVDDNRNIAPEGWHVATDDDWKELEIYLGMSQNDADATGWRGTDEGGKLKEAGTTHWNSPNTGATNESGFTALPAGDRYETGGFINMGNATYIWTSSEYSSSTAWFRQLVNTNAQITRGNVYSKDHGFAVRCVKD